MANPYVAIYGPEGVTVLTEQPCDGGANCPSKAFTDLNIRRWYHEAVDYVLKEGIMVGMSATSFAPDGQLARGQLMTILHRLAGKPKADITVPFTDVAPGRFYTKAVTWAYASGIAKGITETQFAPNTPVTREQLVTFLYRYAKLRGEDVSAEADLTGYTDWDSLGRYATRAMAWAVETGIVKGMTATTLAPKATATRAQIATILFRMVKG